MIYLYRINGRYFLSPPVPCKMAPWRLGNSSLQHPITAASCCSISASQTLDRSVSTTTGWWLYLPLWKYESQLGWLFLIYGKIKNVTNHQPDHLMVFRSWLLCLWSFAHEVFAIQSKHINIPCHCRPAKNEMYHIRHIPDQDWGTCTKSSHILSISWRRDVLLCN